MPPDLDETRLADAQRAGCGGSCDYPECGCVSGNPVVIARAIAAWETSAPKREPATICEIEEEWTRQAKDTTGSFPFGVFLDGVRWAESRQRRAETKGERCVSAVINVPAGAFSAEPPRSGMTKAQLSGLLLALRLLHYNTSMPGIREEIDAVAAAIRAETPDGQ